MNFATPGISEIELDSLAEKLIVGRGAKPGFKLVPGYRHTICISANDVVVHGIPTSRTLEAGDIVGIDCGVYLEGYHTDMAETIRVSNQKSTPIKSGSKLRTDKEIKVDKFLEIGKRAMFAGIEEARSGNRVGHISRAIQDIVEGSGYSVVRSLVGHGVGKKLHEAPEIPGYLSQPFEKTPLLKLGQTLAVEVIYNMGKPDVEYSSNDDWTISTADGSLSGLFERTILITEDGPRVLTPLKGDKT